MTRRTELLLPNAGSEDLSLVPLLDAAEFRRHVVSSAEAGAGISALFAVPEPRPASGHRIFAVLRDEGGGVVRITSAHVDASYPALTPDCPSAHLFEREIAELWGIEPEGHPWKKPVRFPAATAGDMEFYRVEGEEIHEVAVGPVHAGVIEPGHFRFQCHGEKVLHLEISLGYQHRGVEHGLAAGPDAKSIHYAETLAGDTTVGHATAYCQAVEALSRCAVPARGQAVRGIALELERVANHVGDLGALAGDVGYLPTASWCGRIRGDVLNLTALICGSRFGRGLVVPGGVGFDVDETLAQEILERLSSIEKDASGAIDLLWKSPSVVARFEDTGVLSAKAAREIGLVGPAARACGLEADVRHDFPAGIYRFSHIPAATWRTGDVFARAFVRRLEIERSLDFVREQLHSLPAGGVRVGVSRLAPSRMVVSMVEGWRGEICHVAASSVDNRFACYKVVDPSFHNWMGLALALRDGQISDFPLCNKSFNLSYCGHDL